MNIWSEDLLNKRFALCFVIPRSVQIAAAGLISLENSVRRNAVGFAPTPIKGERK
jgi:hypothetical protein